MKPARGDYSTDDLRIDHPEEGRVNRRIIGDVEIVGGRRSGDRRPVREQTDT